MTAKQEAAAQVRAAKTRLGLTWATIGDGIMSAINFKLDVSRRTHPGGDRVVVTFDGKFLDYQW